jgi:hypothetical protein
MEDYTDRQSDFNAILDNCSTEQKTLVLGRLLVSFIEVEELCIDGPRLNSQIEKIPTADTLKRWKFLSDELVGFLLRITDPKKLPMVLFYFILFYFNLT